MLTQIKNEMAALSPITMIETDYAAKGFHLDIQVEPEQVVAAAEILDKAKYSLDAVTGVDLLTFDKGQKKPAPKKAEEDQPAEEPEEKEEKPEPQMEVVYDYNNTAVLCRIVVRARIPRANPEIPTISKIFAGADWHERETHDFFGIRFLGHPNLAPLLLPEDADFHPLLKDFKA